jgi:hypothetical protein
MDYSPLNLVVWLTFVGFVIVVYLIVKVYHSRYPYYPYEASDGKEIAPDQVHIRPEWALEQRADKTSREVSE